MNVVRGGCFFCWDVRKIIFAGTGMILFRSYLIISFLLRNRAFTSAYSVLLFTKLPFRGVQTNNPKKAEVICTANHTVHKTLR